MSDFESKLSTGAIPSVFMGLYKKEYGPLVFQVLAAKPLPQEGSVRLKISDGVVESGMAIYCGNAKPEGLESYAIIELNKYELVKG